jgi:hypothetical protein
MPKYEKMTQEEFDEILRSLVVDNAWDLLSIPGVYEAVSEHFNNEILEIWEKKQPHCDECGDLPEDGELNEFEGEMICLNCLTYHKDNDDQEE